MQKETKVLKEKASELFQENADMKYEIMKYENNSNLHKIYLENEKLKEELENSKQSNTYLGNDLLAQENIKLISENSKLKDVKLNYNFFFFSIINIIKDNYNLPDEEEDIESLKVYKIELNILIILKKEIKCEKSNIIKNFTGKIEEYEKILINLTNKVKDAKVLKNKFTIKFLLI